MNKAIQYINDVVNNRIVTGKYIKLVCQRHLDDLAEQNSDFYFDEATALHYISAIEIMPFAKGKLKGKPFVLQPWQAAFTYMLYGWKRKLDGYRRFTKGYLKVARKGGKTEYLAAISNLGLTLDSVPGAEIFWAATKRDQAKIGWKRQRAMIDIMIARSPALNAKFGTNQVRIFAKNDDSFSTALGRDSKTEDGLMPYYGIIDEYHAHADSGMLDILETGTGAFDEPLILVITTAGYNTFGPCKKFEDNCKKILDNIIDNDEVLPFIFDLDDEDLEGDNWKNPKVWQKANPGLGISPTMRSLKTGYKKAVSEGGSSENSFKTKQLNIWTNAKSSWIKAEFWRSCKQEYGEDDLIGRQCFAGLDLGKSSDTTALVLLFPPTDDDPIFRILSYFWTCETAAEAQKDVSYWDWEANGYITITEGNVTDYDFVQHKILELAEKFEIEVLGFDIANSSHMITQLTAEGINAHTYPQSWSAITAPTNEVKDLIIDDVKRLFAHNDNKCMNWQISNAEIKETAAGLRRIVKGEGKNRYKVDGPVALVFAYGEYLTWLDNKPKKSRYEDEDAEMYSIDISDDPKDDK